MFKAKGKVSVAAFSAVALALAVGTAPANAAATGKIEVFSWWTSGSEDAALQAIIAAAKAANPGLDVINAAVAGGALIGVDLWKSAALAGIMACAQVIEKLLRFSVDGSLSKEEIELAFTGAVKSKPEVAE